MHYAVIGRHSSKANQRWSETCRFGGPGQTILALAIDLHISQLNLCNCLPLDRLSLIRSSAKLDWLLTTEQCVWQPPLLCTMLTCTRTFKNRLLQLCPWELPTHGWGSSHTCKMPTNLRLTILAPKILRKSAWIVTKRKSQKLYVISFCSQFSPKFFHYSL